MATTDLHSLTAPYALDALDAHERTRFENHLEQCEACRRELAGFQATSARLGEAAEQTPPPALRERLLTEVSQTRQEPPVVASLAQHRLRSVAPRIAAAAAVAVAVAGIGGFLYERDRAESLQAQSVAVSEVMRADDATFRTNDADSGGSVRVVMSPAEDAAVVMGADLEPLDDEHDYQVWAMHDGVPRSVGVLSRDASMVYVEKMKGADAFAITVEPAGGSEKPTTEPVAALDT